MGRRNTRKNSKYSPVARVTNNDESLESDNIDVSASSIAPRPKHFVRCTTPEIEIIEKGRLEATKKLDWQSASIWTNDSISDDSFDQADDLLDSAKKTTSMHEKDSKQMENVDKYMAKREMTPLQERVNAITVIPGAFYCFLFLLSGSWLSTTLKEQAMENMLHTEDDSFDSSSCISNSWLPNMHAAPPLPVTFGALGIIFHAPFSFLYHWHYAHRLPPGLARTTHWSRRMDQSMIHFFSATMSYATSGRWDYFYVNLGFNMYCIYKQFLPLVVPRGNQVRVMVSVLAYTIPIMQRDLNLFVQLWLMLGLGSWLFAAYPFGGWSHALFHIVLAFIPPFLMMSALDLPASQDQLRYAAQCSALASQPISG